MQFEGKVIMGTIANYLPTILVERRSDADSDFSLFSEFDIYLIPFINTAYSLEQYKRFNISKES
jgi:hypothetical protein